jgi:hypothetical protein
VASSRPLSDIITPRRLITLAVLLLVVLVVVVGFQHTVTANGGRSESCKVVGTPIEQLHPCPGDTDPNQLTVGVDMDPSWQVDMYLDGTPIPKDQMEIEATEFSYVPGPGTATGPLAPGIHTAKIVYYQNLAQEASGQVYSWTFTTH